MYLAIEKTVGIQGVGGASFEENVLVTGDGVDILTAGAPQGI
jgi:Xaa-Pro aminopeptidase